MIFKRFDLQYEVVDLKEFGISNVAFDLPSAISFMYEAVTNDMRILGGDIIVVDNGKYIESDDSWYSNRTEPMETMQDALNYLCSYWRNCDMGRAVWYVTVVLSK